MLIVNLKYRQGQKYIKFSGKNYKTSQKNSDFLTYLWYTILTADPFLKIRSVFRVQSHFKLWILSTYPQFKMGLV